MAKAKKIEGVPLPEQGIATVGVVIKPLQEKIAEFTIRGTAPYMQLRFSEKAKQKMTATQKAGSTARSKRTREARDFESDYESCMYRTEDGRYGIPCSAFRNAMISACRTIGFKMTLAKLSVFVEQDAEDTADGTPLVLLNGQPEMDVRPVRNANGAMDLRVRAIFRTWSARVRVRFDVDQFTPDDVYNLMTRVGRQVGVGEGRPDSRMSPGLSLGLFMIED